MKLPIGCRTGDQHEFHLMSAAAEIVEHPLAVARFAVRRAGVRGGPAAPLPAAAKRGPKPAVADAELIAAIRRVLAATPFNDEGYR